MPYSVFTVEKVEWRDIHEHFPRALDNKKLRDHSFFATLFLDEEYLALYLCSSFETNFIV